MKYKLRDYQQRASDKAVYFFNHDKKDKSAIIVVPSAGGKSLVIADTCNRLLGHVLVLQPSKEILEQNYEKFISYGGHAGIFSASVGRKDISRVTFATPASVKNHLSKFSHVSQVIVDECHLGGEARGKTQFKTILNALDNPKVLGFTATPFRLYPVLGGSMVKILSRTHPRIYNKIIDYTQIGELRKRGFLSELKYYRLVKGFDRRKIKVNSTGSDFDEESLKDYYKSIDFVHETAKIVERVNNAGRQVLCFTSFVADAEYVAEILNRKGFSSVVVHGKTKKKLRGEILDDFASGKYQSVINVGTLCVDSETEILTEKGWCQMDEMTQSKKIACWNNDGTIFFDNPKRVFKRKRLQGERMVRAKGSCIDFRVTENHEMIHGIGVSPKWKKSEAINLIGRRFSFPSSGMSKPISIYPKQELYSEKRIKRMISYNSYVYRKKGIEKSESYKMAKEFAERRASMKYKNPKELTLDECRFIGFWLGDGTLSSGRCSIAQSTRYQNIIEWFDGVLSRMNMHFSKSHHKSKQKNAKDSIRWNFSRGTGGDGQFIKNGFYSLEPYLNKEGSNLLFGLDRSQFESLMEGFWYADGEHSTNLKYKDGSRNRWRIKGTQKSLYDKLQAIGTCRGYRITVKHSRHKKGNHSEQWSISWTDTKKTSIGWGLPKICDKENEFEYVWCVESPSSNIITRRNGVVTIMGNCTGYDYPKLGAVLIARPMRSLSLYMQIVCRGSRIHPDKEDCWIIDCCGNFETFGRIEDIELKMEGKYNNLPYLTGTNGKLTGVLLANNENMSLEKKEYQEKLYGLR